jgi:rRNA small subunit pseudouridine methyltransferase Nep1
MLVLVFIEAALELVPRELWRHPAVRESAKRRGKKPGEILLDRALHHAAMRNLEDSLKRGRPDILHLCLLEALGTPLNREQLLRIYVHTHGGTMITVSSQVRLPRNYNRFVGLMEQLLLERRVPLEGEALLTAEKRGLEQLVEEMVPTRIIALTSHGEPTSLKEVCSKLAAEEKPMVFVGAYPHGAMGREALKMADRAVSIDPEVLDAWVVTSRLLYQYEVDCGLQKRLAEKRAMM